MDYLVPVILGYLFIFFARVIDMSLDVIRVLMLMRDRRVLAAFIGFLEVSVFIMALNQVLAGGLNDPGKIVAYAAGFATGNYVGSLIESWLAIGYLSVQVFPRGENVEITIDLLRAEGFGVTRVSGEGRDGPRTILFVAIKRKDMKRAVQLLDSIEPGTFYNVSDAKCIRGGVFPGNKKCV